MRDVNVAEMKDVLSAIKQEEQRQKARLSDYFAVKEEAFRKGVATRLRARDLLATHVRPDTPTYTTLDTPFLIWAFRNGGPTNILSDTHIEPLNSWARFQSSWEHGDTFLGQDEVGFYFFWQNDGGSDAVVNVESHLMLAGMSSVFAKSGLIWSPFWGQGTIGRSRLTVDAKLTLFEWWHQPPTQPLQQPSQQHEVVDLSASGGWAFLGSGNGEALWLSGTHYVHYDAFLIPVDAVAVFEVSLNIYYSGYKGSGSVDFQTAYESLICPYVQLEGLTAPLMASG